MALVAWAGVNLEILVAPDQQQERDQPADDVQAVETGGQVEHGAVRRRGTAWSRDAVTSVRYSFAWPSTKISPSTKLSRYQRRSEKTSPRSAANTPNWQVNDDATRMIVKTSA